MLHDKLQQYFGFETFNPGQEAVITHISEGHSAAAIFPTGSGKSLCYQLSAMCLPHLTLVVSPLLALISDQLEFLNKKGIPAARIDSTLTYDELRSIQADVKSGKIKILMISVERFKNERFRQFLSGVAISMLVVDEAHCISEWGHNFRPDYLKLPAYRAEFKIQQVLLLTATATPKVITDMCRAFNLDSQHVTLTGFHRPNLHLQVKPVAESRKSNALLELIKKEPEAPTIVYVTLQKTAEVVASQLVRAGIHATAYHAGMKNEERERIQADFMVGKTPVIVATIAFGMGIDKGDIRRVIHYDLPKSIENYSQEIGRAGRDGQTSDCILLGNLDGVNVLENFVYGDTPERQNLSKILQKIQDAGDTWEIKMLQLSNSTNIRQLPLKTLLVYLETEGIIKPLYSYFGSYRIKCLRPEETIIKSFSTERQAFISAIFEHSQKARLWTTVDFDTIVANYPTDRKRIAAALEYFEQQGWIELEAKQMIEVFEVTNSGFELEQMTNQLYARFAQKEQAEVSRIQQMIDFFSADQCLSKALSHYFGEKNEWDKCGHCSVCQSGEAKLQYSIEIPPLESYDVAQLVSPLQEKSPQEVSATLLTRFLCGITSPLFTKLKARQLDGFGKLEQYRYQDVKNAVEATINV